MSAEIIKITQAEFEALLFEIYKRGLQKGIYAGLLKQRTFFPYTIAKKHFDALMYELKLKTE